MYELDDSSYDTLSAASYDDMRHAEVFWADSDIMTQIDITLEGEKHVLTSEVDGDDEETRVCIMVRKKLNLLTLGLHLKP